MKTDKTNGASQITDTNANNYTGIGTLSSGATQQTINKAISDKIATLPTTDTNTTYGADRGISNVSGKFGHSNTEVSPVTTSALKKIKYDKYGHITGTDNVSSTDISSISGVKITDTTYANGIDELFDGDTWVVDFYELASNIRDSLESECEQLDIEEIPERIYKKYVDKKINEYIEDFKNNMYNVLIYQLNNSGCIKITP